MSALEIIGVVTGAVCVLLAAREIIWNWPIGIANNIAFFVVFWQHKLYADATLQIFYLLTAIYGWWKWAHKDHGSVLRVRNTSRRMGLTLLVLLPVVWLAIYEILHRWTDSNVPAGDSLATTLSLGAQFMAGRKLLENWLVWIVVDVVSIALFLYKRLYLTTTLYAVFIVMCAGGYLAWRKAQLQAAKA
ncbi:MAG: nicotinamide riboside transporter PnuC [Acidobacteriota bacterium]|nr:nicotinamide riboside transporter PnuC [Acidobacteriota bacterium]